MAKGCHPIQQHTSERFDLEGCACRVLVAVGTIVHANGSACALARSLDFTHMAAAVKAHSTSTHVAKQAASDLIQLLSCDNVK